MACGSGRHSRLLASLGYRVLAVDRDPEALARITDSAITTQQLDLESGTGSAWPYVMGRFAGIVVTNYLHRPLFPLMLDSLADGGVLIYETFALGNERFGKPSNPDFLLKPGELLEVVQIRTPAPLHVVAFEDGHVDHPKPAMVQRICAVKTADADSLHRWARI